MQTQIYGQAKVISYLNNCIENQKIAHAYIFSGPPSVGKYKTALAWAQSINCPEAKTGKSCGVCKSCRQIENQTSADVLTILPEGKNIKIQQIRELKKYVQFGPIAATWKIAIIDNAHFMTLEAANSFLKLLEEPLPQVMFILTTANVNGLLKTIISRCQTINFAELQKKDAANILIHSYAVVPEKAAELAAETDGNVTEALLLLKPEIHDLITEIHAGNFKSFFQITELAKKLAVYKEDLFSILNIILKKAYAAKQSALVFLILEALGQLRYNINIQLHLENLFLKMSEAL